MKISENPPGTLRKHTAFERKFVQIWPQLFCCITNFGEETAYNFILKIKKPVNTVKTKGKISFQLIS